MKYLQKVDHVIAELVRKEQKRQEETLMMIPSENIASFAVEEALGTSLGNKYAEGYPFKRYYQGQKIVDQVESLVIDRVKKMFKVPHANVQPYSGSPANFAVYNALLEPRDVIMGLSLSFGGHLTHGAAASATSKYFESVQYGLRKNGVIDYENVEKHALKYKPKIIVAGITAYPRVIDWKKFAEIAKKVGAYLLADVSHLAGLIIGGVYPTPVPYADVVTTTTHKTLRGPRGAIILVTEKGLKKDPDLAKKVNKSVFPGLQGGPHINTIAAIGVCFKEASSSRFKKYAKQVVANAKVLASELKKYKFSMVTGGTDSHLLLIDLRNKGILGKLAAEACEEAGIVFNFNTVPFDPNPPFNPSGIRLGTPGITSRGMKEKEMETIAKMINDIVTAVSAIKKRRKFKTTDEKDKKVRQLIINKTLLLKKINQEVKNLCQKFPVKKVY